MRPSEAKMVFGLRSKFALLVGLAVASTALGIGYNLFTRIEQVYMEARVTRARTIVSNLAFNAEFATLVGSADELKKLVDGVMRDSIVVYTTIYDTTKLALVEEGRNIQPLDLKKHAMVDSGNVDGLKTCSTTVALAGGRKLLVMSSPIVTWAGHTSRENLGGVSPSSQGAPDGNWTKIGKVTMGFDLSDVQRTVANARATVISIALAIALVVILITIIFVRFIVKPLSTLAHIAQEISQGRLDQKLDVRRSDEIGELAMSFELMAVSLRLSKREVEDYQSTLESKIRERTSELEVAQSQLLHSEKMNAIGQLAAGVAHELNNPLAGILGYAQFALEKVKNKPADQMTQKDITSFTRYLNDIENQARRCKAIVQNLLKFSRSSRDIEAASFDLNEALQETIELLRHQLEMNHNHLHIEIDPSLPQLYGNSGKLQQVFANIIINAMQATPKGGALTVRTKHTPTLGEYDGSAEISFTDMGCGIPPEAQARIFEPFFTTKEVGKGTGLGLSVSYGIVKEHGGEIKVSSETGKGTTFTIILPLQRAGELADIPRE